MGSLSRLGTFSGKYLNVLAKQPVSFRYKAKVLFHASSYLNGKFSSFHKLSCQVDFPAV